MKNSIVWMVILLCAGASACTKSDDDILKEHLELTKKASVNVSLRKLESQLQSAKDDSERASIYAAISGIHIKKGTAHAALKAALESVKYQPNLFRARYLLGKSYISLGRYSTAVVELEKAVSLKNDFAPAHFELGNAYYKLNSAGAAVREFTKATAIDPAFYMAWNNLGVLYHAAGNHGKAVAMLNKVITIRNDYAPAHKNLGIIYDSGIKNPSKARYHYRMYLKLRPNAHDRFLVKSWIKLLGV